ncbi:MAG: D-alanine--D-alanine ligase [Candidatus Omnitrophica bacterium]|nr:D-alanine--D-alanine ligase [Candidatus Omnitrophota bacterium]
MGGPSPEHAISLKSGQGVTEALTRRGWAVSSLIVPHELTVDEAIQFVRVALQRENPDAVFLALHGVFGEDGAIQQLCEEVGIAYTGSDPAASRLGMDKIASRLRFEGAGLTTPTWSVVDPAASGDPARALGGRTFPVVVKPANQGSSIGVSLAADGPQLTQAIREAARYDTRILIESFIEGRELTVGVVADQPLPIVEIQSHRGLFDYTAKYTPGETTYMVPAAVPARIARRIQEAALIAHRAVGCRDLSRVDLILDRRGRPVILEVNTIPGFTPTSLLPKAAACLGWSYDVLCERLTTMALRREKSGTQTNGPNLGNLFVSPLLR